MSEFDLATAETIASGTLSYARANGILPLAVVVLDARGAVKAALADDGTSLSRFEIARGKAFGCIAFGFGARELQRRPPPFLAAVGQLHGVSIVPVPGGVVVRDAAGALIGAVGASGDTSDKDEEAVTAGIRAAGLTADTGA